MQYLNQGPHSLRFFRRAKRGCPYSGSRVGGSGRAECGCGGSRLAVRTALEEGSTTELAVSSSSERWPLSVP